MQGEADMSRLLDAVLSGISDPVVIFDAAWRVVMSNAAAQSALHMGDQDAHTLDSLISDAALLACVRDGGPASEWYTGEDSVYLPRVVRLDEGADGTAGYTVLVLRDLSAVRRLNRNQNEFVHIVSHDLRSPLTTIKGYTGMLGMDRALSGKQKEYTDKVMSGIHQLTSLVDNIQDAGRFDVETGFYVMQRAQCDVTEVLQRVVGGCVIPAEKQDMRLLVETAPDVPIINADVNMLERALTNLVDNAIKYTPNGGTITIGVRRAHDRIEFTVRDTGLGISAEDQKKLFQRHSRLIREEHRRVKGTGLGLFIVRSVAQRHNGDAWVDSTVGVGSTFGFYIPLQGANLIFGGE